MWSFSVIVLSGRKGKLSQERERSRPFFLQDQPREAFALPRRLLGAGMGRGNAHWGLNSLPVCLPLRMQGDLSLAGSHTGTKGD